VAALAARLKLSTADSALATVATELGVAYEYPKVNGVGDGVQQCSANFARHSGEPEWPLADARERSVDIAEETLGEPGSLVLVPPRGILEIGLSKGPNDEPAAHLVQWLLLNFLRSRS
jgi:hypothetical protein